MNAKTKNAKLGENV